MTYFVAHYGIWLLAAFVIGILAALLSRRTEGAGTDRSMSQLRPADFVFAVCFFLFLAFVQVTSGRFALYCENALALFAAFVTGTAIAAYFDGPLSRDGMGWRAGLVSLAVVWLVSNMSATRGLESDLRHDAGTIVARAGGDPLNLDVRGRDVFLPANVGDRSALAREIAQRTEARYVMGVENLSGSAAKRLDRSIAESTKRLERTTAVEKNTNESPQPLIWNPPLALDAAGESMALAAEASDAPETN